jgi:hypothetical protein
VGCVHALVLETQELDSGALHAQVAQEGVDLLRSHHALLLVAEPVVQKTRLEPLNARGTLSSGPTRCGRHPTSDSSSFPRRGPMAVMKSRCAQRTARARPRNEAGRATRGPTCEMEPSRSLSNRWKRMLSCGLVFYSQHASRHGPTARRPLACTRLDDDVEESELREVDEAVAGAVRGLERHAQQPHVQLALAFVCASQPTHACARSRPPSTSRTATRDHLEETARAQSRLRS